MPKYKITFNISDLLKNFVSDGYFEITGFTTFEVIITTSKTLMSTELTKIQNKLPSVEITKIE